MFFTPLNGNDGIYRLVRTTTTVPFEGTSEIIMQGAVDPDIAADSKHLYFSVAGNLGVMTRMCPTPRE